MLAGLLYRSRLFAGWPVVVTSTSVCLFINANVAQLADSSGKPSVTNDIEMLVV
jgi:hypothetical protein